MHLALRWKRGNSSRSFRRCETRGVLIGGVAEGILQGHGSKRLERRKDVDVMVVDDSFELSESFESGIDWWLPHNRRVRFAAGLSSGDTPVRYWENGNGVVLAFGIELPATREPGLYLAPGSLMRMLRMHEATAGVRHVAAIDNDAVSRLESMFTRRFSRGGACWARKFFDGRTFSASEERGLGTRPLDSWVIGFCPIELEVAVAVRGRRFVDH